MLTRAKNWLYTFYTYSILWGRLVTQNRKPEILGALSFSKRERRLASFAVYKPNFAQVCPAIKVGTLHLRPLNIAPLRRVTRLEQQRVLAPRVKLREHTLR